MKTLILIRHAKSSWDNFDLSDFDRPLNNRGLRDAPRMGKRLKEKDLAPELVISSPANRALTTCTIISETIGFPTERIQKDKAIYHADEDQLLSIVQNLPDFADQVMLYGHNPGFTDFANHLTKSHIDNIPTCGIVACQLNITTWKEVKWGAGKLLFYDFPKNHD
jgi:phosphohistidine phosphatase